MMRNLFCGLLLIAVVMNPELAFGQASEYSFKTLAGNPPSGAGSTDGSGSAARFNQPFGVAVDASGSLYVADNFNHTIRKVTSTGVVSTLAGLAGTPGSADGTGSAARFNNPVGVAVDGAGNLYVADFNNSTIRKVTSAGAVSTLAGLAGVLGSADGTGPAAWFSQPYGVAVDGSGNVYVADTGNHTIRKVTAAGVVSTLAGLAGIPGSADGTGSAARFNIPVGVAVDGSGNVYVADTGNHTIRKATAAGVVSTLAGLAGTPGIAGGTGSAARFNHPDGVAVDGSGNAYVADTWNDTIRKVTLAGVVSTIAGLAGSPGSADGTGSAARFDYPKGIAVDGSGNVYVSDYNKSTIRKVTPASVVSTLAGLAGSPPGSVDGTGSAARFNYPAGVAVDGAANVYVADTLNHTIRKVTAAGVVSTLAGLAGTSGSADGTGSAARFNSPSGVAVDGTGNVYVADSANHTIRKITPAGAVSTLAGLAGTPGSADGAGSAARFNGPFGVTVDGSGNVYVADNYNEVIRKVTPAGVVSTLAGLAGSSPGSADGTGSAARFNHPTGVAVDSSGNVYVADYANYTIRKVTSAGVVSTLAGVAGSYGSADGAGSAARFHYPVGIAVDGPGSVYVADYNNSTIRKVTPAGVVSTIGGLAGSPGSADGSGSAARFNYPKGAAVDSSGNVYVADYGNATIRIGSPAMSVGFVPIVLDVMGLAHYTSELQLTNLGASSATVKISYTGSIGSGTGDVEETIPAGQQVVHPDAISFLRNGGVPIPTSGNQGGTLLVSAPAAGVHVTVRTSADTVAPQPVGRAGLAYNDSDPAASSSAKAHVYGLRTNDADRSNLAVYNMGGDPVSLKVTLVSGDDGSSYEVTAGVPRVLPAFGWYQYSGVLNAAGFSSGYALVERVSGSGPFGAYGVVNDQKTNDGSFIPALSGTLSGSKLTIPVLVETSAFDSELILTNRGSATATFTLRYFESLSPANGSGGTTTVEVAAGQQKIIPSAIDFLRSKGVSIGARGEASYAGSVQIQVSGVGLENVFAGARTSSPSPAGGGFGLFYPAIDSSQEFADLAFVLGLKSDVNNRSNVAAIHTGGAGSGPITLEFQVLDGSEGGKAVGQPLSVTLNPGDWVQPPRFFANGNVPNGYVRVRRTAGTAPWYAYGVINDGGLAGERTGDGSYVPGVQP